MKQAGRKRRVAVVVLVGSVALFGLIFHGKEATEVTHAVEGRPPVHCARAEHRARVQTYDENKGELYKTKTRTKPPFWISFHSREVDKVRWSTYETGVYYEKDVTAHATSILSGKPTGLVIDVGMNIGWFSLLARSLSHNVVGFEPNPLNHVRLCESLQLNGWVDGSVQVYASPIGKIDNDPSVKFSFGSNPGAGGLRAGGYLGQRTLPDIHTVTLDTLAKQKGWIQSSIPIYLLKIDVEGADPDVILGAGELLRSHKVLNIFAELKSDSRYELMVQQILSTGYKIKHYGNWKGKAMRGAPVDWTEGDISNHSRTTVAFCKRQCNLWFSLV